MTDNHDSTIHASTQLLSRKASLELLTDMLKQAEEDKATLREALRPCTEHLDGLVNLNPAGTVVNIDKARVAVATAYAALKDTGD